MVQDGDLVVPVVFTLPVNKPLGEALIDNALESVRDMVRDEAPADWFAQERLIVINFKPV